MSTLLSHPPIPTESEASRTHCPKVLLTLPTNCYLRHYKNTRNSLINGTKRNTFDNRHTGLIQRKIPQKIIQNMGKLPYAFSIPRH